MSDDQQSSEALHETERRFRTLFEAMTEGVALHELILDGNGAPADYRITDANPAYLHHTGIRPEDAIGRLASELYGTGAAPYLDVFSRVATTGVPDRMEIHFAPMGRHFRILVCSPGPGRFATVFEDVTASKQLQAALTEANEALRARNEELDAYAHTVAHDLKNPVSAVLGFAEHLEQDAGRMSERQRREALSAITLCAQKMTDIIDGLLLIAESRRVAVGGGPLDMAAIVAESLEGLEHEVRQHGAEIAVPPTWPEAHGYAPWVERVWTNYLTNAMKYGGRPPRVELGATGLGDGRVRFWVKDDGAGLSPRERAKLFTPFTRLAEVKVEGHGLGLSIVRRLVEKMGGEVGVESAGVPGAGSTFWFTLSGA